ncbi:MAG: hypothetical protein ACXVB7_21725, partial [Ktedonobacteraceae bacterium]
MHKSARGEIVSVSTVPPRSQGDRKGPIHSSSAHLPLQRLREGSSAGTYLCKGGSGVEWGGDPCGRP